MTNLYDINENIRIKLTDKILNQKKYKYVSNLNACNNYKITNVSQTPVCNRS